MTNKFRKLIGLGETFRFNSWEELDDHLASCGYDREDYAGIERAYESESLTVDNVIEVHALIESGNTYQLYHSHDVYHEEE